MLLSHAAVRWASTQLARIPRGPRSAIISVCGFIALIMPLALWAAMTTGLFKLAFVVWCGALVVIGVLVSTSSDERF